jgi:hypothetical protein
MFTLVQTWAFQQNPIRKALNIELADPKIIEGKLIEMNADADFRMLGYIAAYRKLVAEGPMMKRVSQFRANT